MTPATAAPPIQGRPSYPLMHSLRAISIFLIFVIHAAVTFGLPATEWYSPFVYRAGFALAMFFVMSAFLLYRPFVAASLRDAPFPSVRRYARGRFVRIFPAYWLALTLLAIYPGAYGVFTDHFWVYYSGAQAYVLDWAYGGIPQAWVVSVLLSFYLVLPLLALSIRNLFSGLEPRSRLRAELILIGALYLLSVVYRLALTRGDVPLTVVGLPTPTVVVPFDWVTALPGIFDWLALGMALAVVSAAFEGRTEKPRPIALIERAPSLCWLAALGLYVAACLALFPQWPQALSVREWFAGQAVYGAIAVLLLLPAIFDRGSGGLPRRLLSNPTLLWLGVISYGFYLWHGLILSQLGERNPGPLQDLSGMTLTTIGLAITLTCAVVSYYAVERPLVRRSRSRQAATAP